MTLAEFRQVYPTAAFTVSSGKAFTYRYYQNPQAKATLVLLSVFGRLSGPGHRLPSSGSGGGTGPLQHLFAVRQYERGRASGPDEDDREPAEVQKVACLPAVSAHQADDEMGGDEKENRWLYAPGKGRCGGTVGAAQRAAPTCPLSDETIFPQPFLPSPESAGSSVIARMYIFHRGTSDYCKTYRKDHHCRSEPASSCLETSG